MESLEAIPDRSSKALCGWYSEMLWKYRQALEFYADEQNYHQTGWQGGPDMPKVLTDGGARARETLDGGEVK